MLTVASPNGEGPKHRRISASGVSVQFDGVLALDDVDLKLNRGEVLGLIGPNGAGKTTLINVLCGFQGPTRGKIFIDEADVTGWSPPRIAREGIARTFQSVRVFGELSVFENVQLGALGVGMGKGDSAELTWRLLRSVNLDEKHAMRASALPYGEERRIGLLRALAMQPSFLLLDEPAAGLNESETDQLLVAIARVQEEFGFGVLLVEHDMRVIMRLCHRIQVLDHGKTIALGTPEEIRRDPAVVAAYLGTKEAGGDE